MQTRLLIGIPVAVAVLLISFVQADEPLTPKDKAALKKVTICEMEAIYER